MKLKYSFLLFLVTLFFSITSCTKELERINKNPNATENAQPDYLLTAATKTAVDQYWGITRSSNPTSLFVQQWAMIQYTDPDRYIFTNNDFQGVWTVSYLSIVNLNQVIKLADGEKNPNYKGVALVLRSWIYTLLTDNFGDVPYKQSIKIDQYLTPAYDPQKEVYEGLLADLKTAQAALDPNGKAIAGDIIYNNNISLWKKFANSLRLRIALRIADQEPETSKQVITDIQNEGGSFISNNSEIAKLAYFNSPNQNPISNYFDTRDDYRISKTIIDKLIQLQDPRLSIYAAKTQTSTPAGYVGLPNGLLVGDASNYGFSKTSKPGAYFLDPRAPAVIFSYSELLFDRAEAAARGFTNDDAADLYAQAIKASLKQYNISDAATVTDYLAQASVQYDAANFKKSIGEQKWIALFGQGLEAFAEWRRLDYPQLSPAVAGVLEGKIPSRFIYPGTEQSLNGQNYKAAVANQGPDVLTTKLWFDVK
ncbi:MAG: SusD/RagB family nutrient-binding outer membrane lipoprotein [Ginsengibacter sp.]